MMESYEIFNNNSVVVWPAIQLFFFLGNAVLQLRTNVFTYFTALLL